MYQRQNDLDSEINRDQLLQSTLAYWSTAAPLLRVVDPLAWEAGSPVPATRVRSVLVVLAIVIALSVLVIIL